MGQAGAGTVCRGENPMRRLPQRTHRVQVVMQDRYDLPNSPVQGSHQGHEPLKSKAILMRPCPEPQRMPKTA